MVKEEKGAQQTVETPPGQQVDAAATGLPFKAGGWDLNIGNVLGLASKPRLWPS